MPADIELLKRFKELRGIACSARHGRPRYPFYPATWWCYTRIQVKGRIYSLFSDVDIADFDPPRCAGRRFLFSFERERLEYFVLPKEPPGEARSLSTAKTDVLVIGGGLAGVAAALEASSHGVSVILVNESRLGGFLGAADAPLPGEVGEASTREFFEKARRELDKRGVKVLENHVYVGRVDEGYMVVNSEGVIAIKPRIAVIATGGFSPLPVVKGNDLPGVVSAEYALRLASQAAPIRSGVRSAIVIGYGEEALLAAGMLAKAGASVTLVHWESPRKSVFAEFAAEYGVDYVASFIEEINGDKRVRSVTLADGTVINADLVVSALPPYPDALTPMQAGASARFSLVTNSFTASKTVYQEAVEGSVVVAGLAAGAVATVTSYGSGVLAGVVAAWRLGKAVLDDVKTALEEYASKYGGASILAEDKEPPRNITIERPHALVSTDLQDDAYIDPCNDVQVKDLRRLLKALEHFKIFTLAERLGIGRGPELGRVTLQTAAQVASVISNVPVDTLGFPLLTHLVRPVEAWRLAAGRAS